jgi:hypothetical protein
MQKSGGKYRLPILLLLAAVSALGLFMAAGTAYSRSYPLCEDYFTTAGVTLSPDTALDADKQSVDSRYGLKLKPLYAGAETAFVNNFSGAFDIELYGGGGVKEYSLTFTDAAQPQNTFAVNAVVGTSLDVSVRAFGKAFGVWYYTGEYNTNILSGSTAAYNAQGKYTKVGLKKATVISFNPDTMTVSAGEKGGQSLTVWDFSRSEIDGQNVGATMRGFAVYGVKIKFINLKQAGDGGLTLFSVCGQNLSGDVLTNSAAPKLFADIDRAAVVGTAYTVPKPYAADFLDGLLRSDAVAVRVSAPDGGTVLNSAYKDGLTFTPETAGGYTVTYTVYDTGGLFSDSFYALPAVSAGSAAPFIVYTGGQGALLGGQVGADSELLLPAAKIVSDGYLKPHLITDAALTVKRGGTAVSGFDNVAASVPRIFRAVEQGTYTVEYGGGGASPQTVTYTVDSSNPARLISSAGLFETRYAALSHRSFSLNNTMSGVAVSSAANGTVTYKKPIDLNGKTKDDLLLQLIAEPERVDAAGFTEFTVTLTDIYDADNFIKIQMLNAGRANGGGVATYTKTAPNNGLPLTGMNTYPGQPSRVTTGATDGFVQIHSFYGTLFDGMGAINLPDDTLNLFFDYGEKALYSLDTWNEKKIVLDYDDPAYIPKLWDGFTTGECYMSISVGGVSGAANYMILTADGYSLAQPDFADTVAPRLSVDRKGEVSVPDAIVGVPYPLFTAAAKDNFDADAPEVDVSAYKFIGGVKGAEIPIADGKITPDAAGQIAVVYSAADNSGNRSSETVIVTAKSTAPAPQITLNPSKQTAGYVGERIILPDYTLSGGSGDIKVTVSVKLGSAEIDCGAGYFEPLSAGSYTVTHGLLDYLGRSPTVPSYNVTVTKSANPIFKETPVLPPAFIHGYTYTLPDAYGYDYYSGAQAVKIKAAVKVSDANGERILSDGIYVPNIAAHGAAATVTYTVTSPGGTANLPYTAPVHKVEAAVPYTVNPLNYFTSSGVTADLTTDCMTAALTGAGTGGLAFIRELNAEKFSLRFGATADLSGMRIILSDSLAPSVTVTLNIRVGGGVAYISAGGKEYALSGAFDGETPITVKYDNRTRGIADGRGYDFIYPKLTNGGEFNGFTSGALYMRIEIDGAAGGGIAVTHIAGQPLINLSLTPAVEKLTYDLIAPTLVLNGECGGQHGIGAEIALPSARAFDVLSEMRSVTVTVSSPSGFVTALDGTVLNQASASYAYRFTANAYGRFNITYAAVDTSYNSVSISKVVYIVDNVPPTASLNGGVAAESKLGDTITLPEVTADDNMGAAALKIRRFAVTPSTRIDYISGDTYTFGERGVYTLRWLVSDAYDNYCIIERVVTVK